MDIVAFDFKASEDGKRRYVQYRTSPSGPLKEMEITEIDWAERRIPEVARVNHQRAPELLATFNVAFLVASRVLTQLEYEHLQAKIKLADIKGILLLDKVAAILAAKGLSSERNPAGSEGLRQAVIDTDPEYRQQQEVCNQLACARDLFENKKKGVEMAYTSVKKILGETLSPYGVNNPNLGGGERAPNNLVAHGRDPDYPSAAGGDPDIDSFFGKAR